MFFQTTEVESYQLKQAKYYIDYLLNNYQNYFQKKKINSLNDKFIFYDLIFCLGLIGEALNKKNLPKTYKNNPNLKSISLLCEIRDKIIHYYPKFDKARKIFKSRHGEFLDLLIKIFKPDGLQWAQNAINAILNGEKCDAITKNPFGGLSNRLDSVPKINLLEKSENYIKLINEEIKNFDFLSKEIKFNEEFLNNISQNKYHALLCSCDMIIILMKESHLNIFYQNVNLETKKLIENRNRSIHKIRIDRMQYNDGKALLIKFSQSLFEIKDLLKKAEQIGLKKIEMLYAPEFNFLDREQKIKFEPQV